MICAFPTDYPTRISRNIKAKKAVKWVCPVPETPQTLNKCSPEKPCRTMAAANEHHIIVISETEIPPPWKVGDCGQSRSWAC